MADIVTSIIFILVGMLSSAGALFNSDWLLDSRQTQFISQLVGRNGARVFYGILGIGCFAAGVILFLGEK